jgi:hypothetical protein
MQLYSATFDADICGYIGSCMSYLEQLISTVAILHWYEATLPYHN